MLFALFLCVTSCLAQFALCSLTWLQSNINQLYMLSRAELCASSASEQRWTHLKDSQELSCVVIIIYGHCVVFRV